MKNSKAITSMMMCLLASCGPAPPARDYVSAEEVDAMIIPPDANIQFSLSRGYLTRVEQNDLPAGIYDRFVAMAQRMKLPQTPDLYIDMTDRRRVPQAEARFTKEEHAYIVTNRSVYTLWTPEQLLAVFGHELVHLRKRHVTAENIALAFNDPSLSIKHELEADKIGSGPDGSCNPLALEEALKIVTGIDESHYLAHHPGQTPEDYDAAVGIDHPLWADRAARLEDMAAHPPEACVKTMGERINN